jgi:methylenetetrahydrofolate reductase (NADPH)
MAQALRPLFVNVTWGAGGSTSARSLELAEICQRQLGLTTCLHLTCTNMSKRIVDSALKEAKELGIKNILALRGDPPRGDEYKMDGQDYEGAEDFVWAVDLVQYIRKEYGNYFCIGVAGYPEGHSDESNPADQDPRRDMPSLVEKVRAGADFIMTQLFYDAKAFLKWEELVREWDNGALKDVTIIPGLMPIQSYQVLTRTTKLSHARLPADINEKLAPIRGNDEEVKKAGVDILQGIVRTIKQSPNTQVRGFHFYTLNLEKAVSFVVERCNLIPSPEDSVIDDSEPFLNGTSSVRSRTSSHRPSARRSSSAHNSLTNDNSRTSSTLDPPSRATTLAISHGVGSLGREATWDDYPNGRFGDARSPAFGEIDGYGTSLHLSPAAARLKWGHPATRDDISDLFLRHLRGDLDQLPWSEGPLNAETRVIQAQLCALIQKHGWWTIASQPAVDGVKSSDPVFGWGPRAGFVFQKAFVEFWIPERDWREVLRPHLEREGVRDQVSWYASPCPQTSASTNAPPSSTNSALGNGDVRTNGVSGVDVPSSTTASQPHTSNGVSASNSNSKSEPPSFESSSPPSAVHSVTWGSFPGKEIVTPTIIEEISFRAWAEEAFGIWREWERCYAPGSEARKVVRDCGKGLWLVNVIGQQYRDEEGLWKVLMGAGA